MMHTLKPTGIALIFVWALEQPSNSSLFRHKLEYPSENRQDVLVPWRKKEKGESIETSYRYYHLFAKGELESLFTDFGEIIESGYDRDNWYIIVKKL